MPNRQFDRYKQASLAHQTRKADRTSLGMLSDPTVEHLAAIDQADAALALATADWTPDRCGAATI